MSRKKATANKVLSSLEKQGIKVVYVKDAQSIDETYNTFKQIGKLTHHEKQAEQLVEETKDNIDKVIDSIFRAPLRSKVKSATKMKMKNFIEKLLVANTHDTILCFSSRDVVILVEKSIELPEASRGAR